MRENRSDKPETFYHISLPKIIAEEEIFYLGDSSVDSGELCVEFATRLKLDDPEIKSYTLEHDDDDDKILTHKAGKKLADKIKAFSAVESATSETIALRGDLPPPQYSFFDTPTASDIETASTSKSLAVKLPPVDSDIDTGASSTVDESFELSAVGDLATGESVSLSASGVSEALDVAASDSVESSAVGKAAGKTVEGEFDSVGLEFAAASIETAQPSAADSDVHDLGALSTPYIPSGLADAAGITETDATSAPGTTGHRYCAIAHQRVRNSRLSDNRRYTRRPRS